MSQSLSAPAPADRQTILLVDDEQEIVVALQDLFEEHYHVLASTSPAAALALIEGGGAGAGAGDLAVIVSDQRMPEMPGHRFLAEARRLCDAEAILLTGYADMSAVIAAINEGGIVGYANKPWEPEALLALVAGAAERHRLKRALAFEQAAFAGLADGGTDRVSIADADGRVVRRNAGSAGTRDDSRTDPRDVAALVAGAPSQTETEEQDADGRMRWIRTRRIPFTAEAGKRYLLKIESDETARRELERKLQQSEKLQALGTLAGGIAHDFNNLLAAVLGNLELAATRTGNDPRLGHYVANASEAAQRGTALTQRLLSFSRQGDIAATLLDPNVVVQSIEPLIGRSMAGFVTLAFDLDDAAWPVRTDRAQFELALVNLCINAHDAMPRGGEIRLATANRTLGTEAAAGLAPGDYVSITVADSGVGMSDEVRQRALEPFFTTKAPGRGTGLGLPMVHAMAEAAGGAITIDSREGEGTAVTIWLPRAEGDEEAETAEAAATRPSCGRLRVLLAEDDAAVRAVTADQLAGLGHDIVTAESGAAALATLDAEGPFDVLLTDYAMPGFSGVELAEAVAHRTPRLPVLMMTGFAEVGTLPAHVALITKPFSVASLEAALARAMGCVSG